MDERDTIIPFGKAVDIPHFPKESACQSGQGRTQDPAPISVGYVRKEVTLFQNSLKGDNNKERRYP
jgi:hypothetical protein